MPSRPQEVRPWHAESAASVFAALDASTHGLTERFTHYVAVGTLAASVLIGFLGVVLWKYTLVETFFFVIALAVFAIPEGLPVAMSVALAVATTRMARRNVIVRRLTAVEGLGSCTLIATDKTGTLTCNELTVREVKLTAGANYQVTGEGFAPNGQVLSDGRPVDAASDAKLNAAIRVAVLCNEADLHHRNGDWVWRGDAVDVALLSLGHKAGLKHVNLFDQYPRVNQIPFESEHQFAASFHRHGDDTFVFVKGAPERASHDGHRRSSSDGLGDCSRSGPGGAGRAGDHGCRVRPPVGK